MSKKDMTDEFLSSLADNQLDAEEKKTALNEIANDETLKKRLSETLKLKGLIKDAYSSPPRVAGRTGTNVKKPARRVIAVAAAILFALGTAIGWMAHAEMNGYLLQAELKSHEKQIGHALVSGLPNSETNNVVLHINSASIEKSRDILDLAERVLQKNAEADNNVKVEIVANGGGLNLFRKGRSSFSERIERMQKEYGNLTFVACAVAAKRIQKREGAPIYFLPGIKVASSAVEQIVKRVKEGWKYRQI